VSYFRGAYQWIGSEVEMASSSARWVRCIRFLPPSAPSAEQTNMFLIRTNMPRASSSRSPRRKSDPEQRGV
jgi:hypothetical protein